MNSNSVTDVMATRRTATKVENKIKKKNILLDGASSSKRMVNEQHNLLPLSLSHIRIVESFPTEVSLKTQVANKNQDLVMCKKIKL